MILLSIQLKRWLLSWIPKLSDLLPRKKMMDSNELNLLLDFTQRFNDLVEKRAQEIVKSAPRRTFMSDQVNDIAAALSRAQGEYLPLFFNKTNPYERWEFNDLEAIIAAARPALTKYEISFIQQPCVEESGATILYTRLIHSSGQWLECTARVIPPQNNQHEFDSILAAQKRAAAYSILGLAAKNDRTDDDSEIAMRTVRNQSDKGTDLNLNYNTEDASYDRISKDQLQELEYVLSEFPDMVTTLLKRERIETLADLPKSRYRDTLNKTHEIAALRKGIKK